MVEIREVTSKRDLIRFVDYPNQLYKGNPYYVPSTFEDDVADWDRQKNPAFEYCEGKCFLAYRDGRIVGRIGAILSEVANKKWGHKRMRFTQVDFIDDAEVVDALFGAVEAYAREKECLEVHGPLGFSDLDREGMLVEGYNLRSLFYTYYNHPYYNEHMARLGYTKDVDWVEMLIHVPKNPPEKLARIADLVQKRGKYSVAKLSRRRDIKPYVRPAFDLLNDAYANLYGVVPLTERQVVHYMKKFLPLLDPRFVKFVLNEEGRMVAFGVAAPSLSGAFQKNKGRLYPFGFIQVLRALKGKNEALELFLVAVRPDLQGSGVNSILINEILKNVVGTSIHLAETGPELETNEKVQAQWRFFETEQHKRRRCYIKQL